MTKTSKQNTSINNTNKKYKNKKTKKPIKNVKNYLSNNRINKMRGGVLSKNVLTYVNRITNNKDKDLKELLFSRQLPTFSNEEYIALAEALLHNTTVKKLDISTNFICYENEESAIKLVNILLSNRTLTELVFSQNYCGYKVAEICAEALKSNQTLTTLDISSNNIGDVGAIAFAQALNINQTLTTLDISHNNIGDEGVEYIVEELKTNKTLTTLGINNNKIGNIGARALAVVLGKGGNTTLTTLDISHNYYIGDEGAKSFAEALKINESLTTLDISATNITRDGVQAIITSILNSATSLLHFKYAPLEIDYFLFKKLESKLKSNENALKLFNPSLITLKVPIDNSITQTINFIKKKMNYKKLSESNTSDKIFDKYVNYLTISGKNFNTLIKSNYDSGKESIKTILGSEKYIVNLHGSVANSIFKLPDNINIIFISSIRYISCINFKLLGTNIEKYFDEYLKDPYCFKNVELKKLFKETLIYYGGQYCIDLNLSREVKDHVTGINYMGKDREGNYKINIPYKYNEGEYSNTLSNFLKTEYNESGTQFINPEKQYTILLVSCRESAHLDYLTEDILVFYEQILKRLNFELIYNNNKLKDNKLEDNLNSKYKECMYETEQYMYKPTLHAQYKRNTVSNKGKIQSRHITNKSTIIINSKGISHDINKIKKDIESIKDPNDKKLFFNNLFNILNIKLKKIFNKNTIFTDTKEKIKIIKTIFGDNYLLMFEFLVYCQMNIITYYDLSNNNSKSNVFFLNYVFNNITELKTLDLSKVHININLKIFYFIYNLFKDEKALTILDMSGNDIDDRGALALANILKTNRTLITLDISNNKIGNDGAKALAEALKVNTKLTTLKFVNNKFGNKGETALREVLKVNTKLKIIN